MSLVCVLCPWRVVLWLLCAGCATSVCMLGDWHVPVVCTRGWCGGWCGVLCGGCMLLVGMVCAGVCVGDWVRQFCAWCAWLCVGVVADIAIALVLLLCVVVGCSMCGWCDTWVVVMVGV